MNLGRSFPILLILLILGLSPFALAPTASLPPTEVGRFQIGSFAYNPDYSSVLKWDTVTGKAWEFQRLSLPIKLPFGVGPEPTIVFWTEVSDSGKEAVAVMLNQNDALLKAVKDLPGNQSGGAPAGLRK